MKLTWLMLRLRICPGVHLAEVSVLMVAAMMLSVFDMSEPKSKDGMPLHPGNAEYTGGTIRCALPGHRGAT